MLVKLVEEMSEDVRVQVGAKLAKEEPLALAELGDEPVGVDGNEKKCHKTLRPFQQNVPY